MYTQRLFLFFNGLQVRKKINDEQNILNICVEVHNELFDINKAASE